jgi:hypothetical protein
MEKVRALLDAVKWADGCRPSFIDNLTDATLVVEAGFGEFGNPDLMIVCAARDESKPYCVFVEAKAGTYQASMADNTQRMTVGYNSTINGELSLKYRLATALENAKPHNGEIAEIVEPKPTFEQYLDRLGDTNKRPRHVRKPKTLKLLNALGLIGMPESRCLYVALTWDNTHHVFFNDSGVDANKNLPLFLSGSGRDLFDEMKPRIGWLGFAGVESALNLNRNPEFHGAIETMLRTMSPSSADYAQRGLSSSCVPDDVKELADRIKGRLREAAPRWKPSGSEYSWSLGPAGPPRRVLIKVITRNQQDMWDVFVGIRNKDDKELVGSQFSESKKVVGHTFYGVVVKRRAPDLDGDLAPLRTALEGVYSERR